MYKNEFKMAFVTAVGVALLAIGGCGQKADQNTYKVGPVGPTSPSAYYFTLEAHPAVVQKGGTISLVVRVTNAAGTAIDGPASAINTLVTPAVTNSSGAITTPAVYNLVPPKVYFAGSSTTAASVGIDSTGRASTTYTLTGSGGTVTYINANVEDKSLTIPIQILP